MEGVSRDLQGRSHRVNQIDGALDMATVYWLCWGRAQQRDSEWPVLPLMPDPLVSLCITTEALQAATPVLELRGSESE